jgi:hypothetical protein
MINLQAQTSNRAGLLWPVLAAAALCAGCISIERSASPDAADITRMGEEAVKVCGAGNVKEVTAKTFTCK